MIAELPDCLKVISRPAVGYDRVDIKAARARGIDVCNAPGTNSNAVAELAMGLMLCCARTLPYHFANTKQKLWKNDRNGMELTGKTLGILGLGAIGKELAKKAAAFGMKVLGHSRHIDEAFAKSMESFRLTGRPFAGKRCHFPAYATDSVDKESINKEAFAQMKKESFN